MEFLLYTCRHGDFDLLVPKDRTHWDHIVNVEMPKCNGGTLEELALEEGLDVEGSYEVGYLSVDDGGSIKTINLTIIF